MKSRYGILINGRVRVLRLHTRHHCSWPSHHTALAAAEGPETFFRTKELLIMGVAISVPDRISPVSKANTYNDAAAVARTYTDQRKPGIYISNNRLQQIPLLPYPERLSKQLNVTNLPIAYKQSLNHVRYPH